MYRAIKMANQAWFEGIIFPRQTEARANMICMARLEARPSPQVLLYFVAQSQNISRYKNASHFSSFTDIL